MKQHRAWLALVGLGITLLAGAAAAQTFPARPVRVVVGFAAGGTTDLVARLVAQRLAEMWGQSVVVDSRTGASGMIAAEIVAKAPPDGHTLLVTPQTSLAVAPAIYGKAPYDAARDFAPVTLLGSTPTLMVVTPSFAPRSFAEFVDHAKKHGSAVTYGSGGIGSSPHMAGELLNTMLGIRMTHVPYKGESPALADTIGGQVPIMFGNLSAALPHVKAGKLRALANTGSTRSPLAPEIPTVAESGFKDYAVETWFGLLAPAGTPPALVARIRRDAAAVLKQPEVHDKLTGLGVDIVANTPEEFSAYVRSEIAKYARLVKDANIKGE